MRDVHLGAVEAALARQLGRARPPVDDLAMSSCSIAFGVSPYAGDLTADGPQRTRRSSAESLEAFSPKWLSCAKIDRAVLVHGVGQPPVDLERAPAGTPRRRAGSPSSRSGGRRRLPVIRRPAPPFARATW